MLVLFGLQMMFLTSFVALDLPTGTAQNLVNSGKQTLATACKLLPANTQEKIKISHPEIFEKTKPIRTNLYTPQAPMAIFLGYVLGRGIGPLCISLFVLLGLVGPLVGINPFAAGGGWDYYMQPGFGYLLGMIAGSAVVGWITEQRRTSLGQLLALVCGLLSIHLVGLSYLLGSGLVFFVVQGLNNGPSWLPWVFEQARNLSWYPLPYDAALGLIAIGMGFPFRYLVDLLTAPDLALKSKSERMVEQQMEELMG